MNKKAVGTVLIVTLMAVFSVALLFQSKSISDEQVAVLNQIIGVPIDARQVEKVAVPSSLEAKFPAVDQLYKITGTPYYAVVLSPHGYRAPIKLMVVINRKEKKVTGIKVMQQNETPGYGEWLGEDWFVERFRGRSVEKYLKRVVLKATNSNDIVQITSATITTQAVINGVNSAMGIYRELILGQEADPVPLKVEGYITENE